MKRILILVQTAPYGSAAIPESARACLGLATMPLQISYVLAGDAVWALLPRQDPDPIGATNALQVIRDLAEMDVALLVEDRSLAERGLSPGDAGEEFTTITREQIADLVANADAVLTY